MIGITQQHRTLGKNQANWPTARKSFWVELIMGAGLWCALATSGHANPDAIHVLIVTGMDIPAHDWRQTTPAIKAELEKDSRMKVEVLEDPYRLETTDLTCGERKPHNPPELLIS